MRKRLLAFRDIAPKAPTHILIIPKIHIRTVNDIEPEHAELVGKMFLVAAELADQEGIAEDGYRLDPERTTTWANGQVRGPRTIPVLLHA